LSPRGGSVSGARDTQDEDRQERVSRELIELLNELRVALPGVQVLFAFLLAVPFAQGFTRVTDFQRALYFVVIALTAVSLALLIAPSAWHRLRFRQHDKERILRASNRMSIAGLGFLALAMTGAVMLIADFIYSPTLTIVSPIVAILVYGLLWYVLPILGPRGPRPDEAQS
jgi:amino acid transporter